MCSTSGLFDRPSSLTAPVSKDFVMAPRKFKSAMMINVQRQRQRLARRDAGRQHDASLLGLIPPRNESRIAAQALVLRTPIFRTRTNRGDAHRIVQCLEISGNVLEGPTEASNRQEETGVQISSGRGVRTANHEDVYKQGMCGESVEDRYVDYDPNEEDEDEDGDEEEDFEEEEGKDDE